MEAMVALDKQRSDLGPTVAGGGAIVLALAFNAPYAVLAVTYDYPSILRQPAGEALRAFADGGPALVLTWYAFALCALALAPLAIALSVTRDRLAARPALTLGAASAGVLAAVTQAVGLLRWVFVVPALAQTHADPAANQAARAAAEATFATLNLYGGVAIGEHLGQVLTALFAAQLAVLQWTERRRVAAALGILAALAIAFGTGEGLAISMGADGSMFSLFTIAGFLALTAWLLATGLGLIGRRRGD